MNKFLKEYLVGITAIFVIVLVISTIFLLSEVKNLQQSEREFNLELREQVQTEVHVMTWNQFYNVKERLDLLEESMWLEGYEHTKFESMTAMNNRLMQEQFREILMNNVKINEIWRFLEFPFVSQYDDDAPYLEDCGSASLLMAVRHYGYGYDVNVHQTHIGMINEDAPVDFLHILNYIDNTYGDNSYLEGPEYLGTQVITTSQDIKDDLALVGYDVSDIEVVDDIPHDMPVIWIYGSTPHWIVRYMGWTFDASLGKYLFEDTQNISQPEVGLGIVVSQRWQ